MVFVLSAACVAVLEAARFAELLEGGDPRSIESLYIAPTQVAAHCVLPCRRCY